MSDYGTLVGPGTLRFERLLPGPIERVWAHLTEPRLRARWLAGGIMEMVPGGRVGLVFRQGELGPPDEPVPPRYPAGADPVVTQGRMIECHPLRCLRFTWAEGSADSSEVSFELAEEGGLVRLVLTHRRLQDRAAEISVGSGWHAHLAVLRDVLDGTPPGPFRAGLERLEQAYAERLPAA